MSRTAQPEEEPTDTRPVTDDVVQPKDASIPTAPGRSTVETPIRPKLPPLASLALPGPLSSSPPPATPALSFSTSSPPSSSSPVEPPNGPPRRRHRADACDDDKAHVQAAIYEALRRRWSASSASELQTLADAAAEALRRKQQAHGMVHPAIEEGEAASPAWAALRARKRDSDSLQRETEAHRLVTPSRSSGLVIPHPEGDEEARDQVSPLPSSKRRRSSIFSPSTMTFPAPRAMNPHRSAILRASRQQIRTLSLDAGIAEKSEELSRSQIPNRHSAFDNLLSSLAAVKTARASLSSPFSYPPLRYA